MQLKVKGGVIYKLVSRDRWDRATVEGRFEGAAIDLVDGYIHFSSAETVRETAARHFRDQDDLVIVAVDADRLGAALRWETSRGGALFPHLYAPLDLDAVLWVRPLPLVDGEHVFPADMP